MSAPTPGLPANARLRESVLEAQTAALAAPLAQDPGAQQPLLCFRCAGERFAVPAQDVQRVFEARPVRRVPHRDRPAFRGLVADEGELLLVGSLERLLDLGPATPPPSPGARMIVVGPEHHGWAFQVDLVDGVIRVAATDLVPAPTTLRRGLGTATRLLARIEGEQAAVLHTESLLHGWEGSAA
ncbi:MAG: chemotaxis protein CheW [Phycisphaerales bacterium]|jgi:chemotaxis-related protein WspD